jgi:hypothetical protein
MSLLKGARPELPRRLEQELAAFGQEIKQAHRLTELNVKRAATDAPDPRIFAGLQLVRDAVNATDPVAGATIGLSGRPQYIVPLMFLSPAALYAITFRKAAEGGMVQRVSTVAFEGIDARAVDVQVAPGLALPARRITVNLAPPTCRRRAAITICRSHSA